MVSAAAFVNIGFRFECLVAGFQAVFPLNAKKVQICEIMSSGFAVKI